MHCRIGTKNAILRVLAVKAATFGDVLGRFACRLGTKNAILRVQTVKAATVWAVLAVLTAASGQKMPLYAFWQSRRQ